MRRIYHKSQCEQPATWNATPAGLLGLPIERPWLTMGARDSGPWGRRRGRLEGDVDNAKQIAAQTTAALVGWRLARLRTTLDGPLAVVATGGSLALATLWARLHETTGRPAWSLTPADFERRRLPEGARVLFLSASGRHHDILNAARHGARLGARLHAVVYDGTAPLCDVVRAARGDVTILPAPPPARDLADTQVAIPTVVLAGTLYGGFAHGHDVFAVHPTALPPVRPDLVVALGAGLAAPAAHDFAARCREVGLANTVQGDRRNAAHGELSPLDPAKTWLVHCAPVAEVARLDAYDRVLPPTLHVTRLLSSIAGIDGALSLYFQSLVLFRAAAERFGVTPSVSALPDWLKTLYRQAEEP